MKRLLILGLCMMFLSGCGCMRNDKNTVDDNIIGNDADESILNDNADEGIVNNDNNTNGEAMDETGTGAKSSNMIGDMARGFGDAARDIGNGAGNAMRDMGNAVGNAMR